ncbi:MAG: GNAT family N-acetyltransferase [Rudaea sp.]|uniref:GNAT family N-acetyltransferase n=1 Tax=Rudaea sp. TaxID=2136325 RepID=UPI0039E5FB54
MALAIEKLQAARHDRTRFRCGAAELDRFLKELAGQHQRKHFSTTYVLVDDMTPAGILGFYCLSFGAMNLVDLSPAEQKKLPRHPVPVARMGRLAVDESCRGKGYGALLLQNAVKRCLNVREEIAHYALVVDAKNETAARFYEHFGFMPCTGDEAQWYLPLGKTP